MRQYSGFGSPKDTNERFKLLINHGQTGLNVAFDLPTQLGLDSDDPMAEGEVGRVGMAVDTLRDFEIAFEGIPLDKIGSGLTINAIASIMLAMYEVVAEKYGYSREVISATPQNDILKEMIGRGMWIFPVEPAIRLIGDTIEYSAQYLPRTNPVSICGYHIRESGANPAQEIAYAFEIAITYIDHVLKRGLAIDDFASRFSFNLNIFGNLWEQVAKFRAARRLWAKIIKERYGAKDPKSLLLRMLAGGGGKGLTKEQPENNIVRSAYYALISALSGTQTMALCSYDEAFTHSHAQIRVDILKDHATASGGSGAAGYGGSSGGIVLCGNLDQPNGRENHPVHAGGGKDRRDGACGGIRVCAARGITAGLSLRESVAGRRAPQGGGEHLPG